MQNNQAPVAASANRGRGGRGRGGRGRGRGGPPAVVPPPPGFGAPLWWPQPGWVPPPGPGPAPPPPPPVPQPPVPAPAPVVPAQPVAQVAPQLETVRAHLSHYRCAVPRASAAATWAASKNIAVREQDNPTSMHARAHLVRERLTAEVLGAETELAPNLSVHVMDVFGSARTYQIARYLNGLSGQVLHPSSNRVFVTLHLPNMSPLASQDALRQAAVDRALAVENALVPDARTLWPLDQKPPNPMVPINGVLVPTPIRRVVMYQDVYELTAQAIADQLSSQWATALLEGENPQPFELPVCFWFGHRFSGAIGRVHDTGCWKRVWSGDEAKIISYSDPESPAYGPHSSMDWVHLSTFAGVTVAGQQMTLVWALQSSLDGYFCYRFSLVNSAPVDTARIHPPGVCAWLALDLPDLNTPLGRFLDSAGVLPFLFTKFPGTETALWTSLLPTRKAIVDLTIATEVSLWLSAKKLTTYQFRSTAQKVYQELRKRPDFVTFERFFPVGHLFDFQSLVMDTTAYAWNKSLETSAPLMRAMELSGGSAADLNSSVENIASRPPSASFGWTPYVGLLFVGLMCVPYTRRAFFRLLSTADAGLLEANPVQSLLSGLFGPMDTLLSVPKSIIGTIKRGFLEAVRRSSDTIRPFFDDSVVTVDGAMMTVSQVLDTAGNGTADKYKSFLSYYSVITTMVNVCLVAPLTEEFLRPYFEKVLGRTLASAVFGFLDVSNAAVYGSPVIDRIKGMPVATMGNWLRQSVIHYVLSTFRQHGYWYGVRAHATWNTFITLNTMFQLGKTLKRPACFLDTQFLQVNVWSILLALIQGPIPTPRDPIASFRETHYESQDHAATSELAEVKAPIGVTSPDNDRVLLPADVTISVTPFVPHPGKTFLWSSVRNTLPMEGAIDVDLKLVEYPRDNSVYYEPPLTHIEGPNGWVALDDPIPGLIEVTLAPAVFDLEHHKIHIACGTNAVFYKPASTDENMVSAMIQRLLRPSPMRPLPQAMAWARAFGRSHRWNNLDLLDAMFDGRLFHPELQDEDVFEPWLEHVRSETSSRKRLRTLEASVIARAHPLVADDPEFNALKAHNKSDEMLSQATVDPHTQVAYPTLKSRAIQGSNERGAAATGPFDYAAGKHFARCAPLLGSRNPQITVPTPRGPRTFLWYYVPGATAPQLSAWMNSVYDVSGLHIATNGDDVAIVAVDCFASHYRLFIEADVSMCDQSLSMAPVRLAGKREFDSGPLAFTLEAYARAGAPAWTNRAHRHQYHSRILVPSRRGEFLFTIDRSSHPSQVTGSTRTTGGNTVPIGALMILVMEEVFSDLRDSPLSQEDKLANMITAQALTYGIRLKVQVHQFLESLTFLKGWWLYSTPAAGYVWSRLPGGFTKLGRAQKSFEKLFQPAALARIPREDRYARCAFAFLAAQASGFEAFSSHPFYRLWAMRFTEDRIGSAKALVEAYRPAYEPWRVLAGGAPDPDPDWDSAESATCRRYGCTSQDFSCVAEMIRSAPIHSWLEHPLFAMMAFTDYA